MNASADIAGLDRLTVADTSLLVRAGCADHTIVLLHGIGSRGFSFAPLMRTWPEGPRLIAWDAPGYGRSGALRSDWPVACDYAARLGAVCNALDAKRVHVDGHSFGCLIAGAVGRHEERRCGRIAFLSPALGYKVAPADVLPVAHTARIAEIERLGAAEFARRRAPRLVCNASARPEVLARVADAMSTMALPGYAQAVRMLASGDLLEDAAQIRAATFVMSGDADVITPPGNARQLAEVLQSRSGASCELLLVPDAGHALYLEAPEAILAHLSPFLAEAP